MKKDSLLERTRQAKKTYSYSDVKDPQRIADHWYQITNEGRVLFLVLYTQACRYSKCLGCNLPSIMSSEHIEFSDIIKQIDNFFLDTFLEEDKMEVRKIIISNNGSVLDEETFSTTALLYLIAKIKMECEEVRVLTIETRPEYVDHEELEVLSRALIEGKNPTALEIAIGIEAYSSRIRNDIFQKGLSDETLEKLARRIQYINHTFEKKYPKKHLKIRLKTYFMLKPVPFLSEEDAIVDIKKSIDYLDKMAGLYGFEINMHLNPTYVSRGTVLEQEFKNGNYLPPALTSVVDCILYGENKKISFFIGLNDEGLAVANGSFIRKDSLEDLEIVKLLDNFNATGDYSYLKDSLENNQNKIKP